MQKSALCRSRRELSNAYLLVKFGFDTADNEPSKVWPIAAKCRSLRRYIHTQQIVHRDVKPANFLVKDDGGLCIADFGLAAAFDGQQADSFIVFREIKLTHR